MYRTALILTALLYAVDVVGAAPVPLLETTLASTGAALTGLWLPFADTVKPEADAEAAASATPAEPAEPARSGPTPVQEIVAGILTGSLAAVLMLKLLYGRRRRRDGH